MKYLRPLWVATCLQLFPAGLVFTTTGQDLLFISTMPSVITNITPSDFDIARSGAENQVFVAYIDNLGNFDSLKNVRVRYTVTLQLSPVSGPETREKLYECESNLFSLGPNETRSQVTSKAFFDGDPGARFYKERTIFELSDSEIRERYFRTQRVPDGQVIQEMVLLDQANKEVADGGRHSHTILNATNISLISPGRESSRDIPMLHESNPVFMWSSDLPPHIYGETPVYEIRLYEARGSESAHEAARRAPIYSERTTVFTFRYPAHAPRLVSGTVYYWEIVGFLKGFSSSTLRSELFGFMFLGKANPEIDEILRILSKVCSQDELNEVLPFRERAEISIENDGADVSELRESVDSMVTGKYRVIGTGVR